MLRSKYILRATLWWHTLPTHWRQYIRFYPTGLLNNLLLNNFNTNSESVLQLNFNKLSSEHHETPPSLLLSAHLRFWPKIHALFLPETPSSCLTLFIPPKWKFLFPILLLVRETHYQKKRKREGIHIPQRKCQSKELSHNLLPFLFLLPI